jgi:urease accessory protein
MTWNAHLQLNYRLEPPRTLLRFAHDGPLRVLQSLYPEGDAICHNILVHPPGGLVQGDTLSIDVNVAPGAHALVSTPGATRFYKSTGEAATQRVSLSLAEGARLEWLPLETLLYPGCVAQNHTRLSLAPGAEMMGWDVTALGLPATGQAFDTGQLHQRLHWPGHWLEEAHLDAHDARLMQSPLGLAGQRCMGVMWLACGDELGAARREHLLQVVRDVLGAHPLAATAGATCPNPQLLLVRALAPLVEPVMDLLQEVWHQLRPAAWALPAVAPRIWRV